MKSLFFPYKAKFRTNCKWALVVRQTLLDRLQINISSVFESKETIFRPESVKKVIFKRCVTSSCVYVHHYRYRLYVYVYNTYILWSLYSFRCPQITFAISRYTKINSHINYMNEVIRLLSGIHLFYVHVHS